MTLVQGLNLGSEGLGLFAWILSLEFSASTLTLRFRVTDSDLISSGESQSPEILVVHCLDSLIVFQHGCSALVTCLFYLLLLDA